jgi:hypothetical protein
VKERAKLMDQARKALYWLYRKQYFSNIARAYCISASVSERIIVSSAYSNEKSFTNYSKFSEHIFLIFSNHLHCFQQKIVPSHLDRWQKGMGANFPLA